MKYVKKSIFICFLLLLAGCSKKAMNKPVDVSLQHEEAAVDSDMLFRPDMEVEVIGATNYYYQDGSDANFDSELSPASQELLASSVTSDESL